MITNTTPHKHVLTLSRLLKAAQRELTAINESILPAMGNKVEQLPKHRVTRAPKMRDSNAPRRLSETERHDLETLLLQTTLPVPAIASLLGVTRASVYLWMKKLGIGTHQGHRKPKEAEAQTPTTSDNQVATG